MGSRPSTGYRAGGTGYTDTYEPRLVQTPTMVAFESHARGEGYSRPGTAITDGGGVGGRPVSRGGSLWGGSVLSDAWSIGLDGDDDEEEEEQEGEEIHHGVAPTKKWPFPLGKMETHYDLVIPNTHASTLSPSPRLPSCHKNRVDGMVFSAVADQEARDVLQVPSFRIQLNLSEMEDTGWVGGRDVESPEAQFGSEGEERDVYLELTALSARTVLPFEASRLPTPQEEEMKQRLVMSTMSSRTIRAPSDGVDATAFPVLDLGQTKMQMGPLSERTVMSFHTTPGYTFRCLPIPPYTSLLPSHRPYCTCYSFPSFRLFL